MKDRRYFLKQSALGAGAMMATGGLAARPSRSELVGLPADELDEELKAILKKPVLRAELFPDPVMLQSIDLLKNGEHFIVRARSEEGAEGYAVANEAHMQILWPVFLKKVKPFFEGKDARDLDRLVEDCFRSDSSYKYQSLAIWLPIASAEYAVLDLLGKHAGRTVGELVGDVVRTSIDVYRANNYRGRSAEESVERIVQQHVEEKSRAVKFKLGGRMDLPEEPPGRTEAMIPLLRKALGDGVTIYADANGSYDVEEALRIGRMLEEIGAAFYEEPCPFDWLEETRDIGQALAIPIAGGEQESSMRRFRWMAANDAVQVFQPDLLYFGGFIRSIKVALMAKAVGMPCTPHMSGAGLGTLYVLHYAAVVPNAGPYQEYKGPPEGIPLEGEAGALQVRDGKVELPTGPGLGAELSPRWIAAATTLTLPD